jgi:hypothetical protein
MPVSLYFVLCSMLALCGVLLGCAFLVYAMLKSNLRYIRNAFLINIATVTCIIILSIITKEVFYLPMKFQSDFAESIDVILLSLFVFLGLLALVGIAYYSRSLYLPEAIIKSSFVVSATIIMALFTVAYNASPKRTYTTSAQHKFVLVDQQYTMQQTSLLHKD